MSLAMRYKNALFIGRFQPFHNGHLEVVRHALEIADSLTIVIGSAGAATTPKNPFTFYQRRDMIDFSLDADARGRTKIVGVRDYFNSDAYWLANVRSAAPHIRASDTNCLIGNFKDSSGYYLGLFPGLAFVPGKSGFPKDATALRKAIFESKDGTVDSVRGDVPVGTWSVLSSWSRLIDRYGELRAEHEFIERYKDDWKGAPYPPSFVTADAVVECDHHVLVIRRRGLPGKGLLALPGGFVDQRERIEDAARRELAEETGLVLSIPERLPSWSHVFDHPGRSLRGRTVSHAFYWSLQGGAFPDTRAADDAERCFWLPTMDVMKREDEFFEDHAHVIEHFCSRR